MYPTLSERLQNEWDEAEQARYEGLITEQVSNSLADIMGLIPWVLITYIVPFSIKMLVTYIPEHRLIYYYLFYH